MKSLMIILILHPNETFFSSLRTHFSSNKTPFLTLTFPFPIFTSVSSSTFHSSLQPSSSSFCIASISSNKNIPPNFFSLTCHSSLHFSSFSPTYSSPTISILLSTQQIFSLSNAPDHHFSKISLQSKHPSHFFLFHQPTHFVALFFSLLSFYKATLATTNITCSSISYSSSSAFIDTIPPSFIFSHFHQSFNSHTFISSFNYHITCIHSNLFCVLSVAEQVVDLPFRSDCWRV